MSTFETIKAQLGDGPAYPLRGNFNTIHGYQNGTVLGTFPTVRSAKDAGATVTETVMNEIGYTEALKAFQDHAKLLHDTWYAAIREEHPEMNDKTFSLIYGEAWERNHSEGYESVENLIDHLVDFCIKVIEAQN